MEEKEIRTAEDRVVEEKLTDVSGGNKDLSEEVGKNTGYNLPGSDKSVIANLTEI